MLLLLALAACKNPDDPPSDGVHLAWDDEDPGLVLFRDAEPVLSFAARGIEVATVEAYDDAKSYDPFWDDFTAVYHPASSGEVTAIDGGFVVDLAFDGGGTGVLTATQAEHGGWDLSIVPAAANVAYFRLTATIDAEEGVYGLGEHLDGPNHRGFRRALQLEASASSESGYNEAHVPVPLMVGTSGWGWFVEDPHPAVADVGTVADDALTFTIGTGAMSADGLNFHLYAAASPLDVYAGYYATVGPPGLPAPWAFGPLVWRNENVDQAQFEGDLAAMRDLDLACSGVWIDRPYATGVNTFDFDPAKFDDPQGMIDRAHDAGFRVALWHTPYADPDGAPVQNAEAVAGGYFAPEHPPVVIDWGPILDFTNPDAVTWWQGWIARYIDMGIEGFKLDFAEEPIVGLNGNRLPWLFFDGSDERTMHIDYQRLYHATYKAMLPEEGGFLLCRTGAYGEHVNGCVVWPGDLDGTLSAHGETVVDPDGGGSYVSVGGLPAALAAGLSVSASGYPFYASDTGGYRHTPPSKETFTRWFEQTALSSAMQIGGGASFVAWEADRTDFDAEMLGWYRDYTRLHLRLFPYVWTHAADLAAGGRPIVRPFGLAHPETGLNPSDAYFLGDDLLVAPVVTAGAVSREVPFPAGRWIDWFTGEIFEGPGEFAVDAPLEKLPLYLREGGIVPLLRPTIDTVAPTTTPDAVDSYANDAGILYARIFPGVDGAITLFDGAQISVTDDALTWADGSTFTQGAMFEIVGVAEPASVAIDGSNATRRADRGGVDADGGWTYTDEAGGMLVIRVPAGSGAVVVVQ